MPGHVSDGIHSVCSTTEEKVHLDTVNIHVLQSTIIISILNKTRKVDNKCCYPEELQSPEKVTAPRL